MANEAEEGAGRPAEPRTEANAGRKAAAPDGDASAASATDVGEPDDVVGVVTSKPTSRADGGGGGGGAAAGAEPKSDRRRPEAAAAVAGTGCVHITGNEGRARQNTAGAKLKGREEHAPTTSSGEVPICCATVAEKKPTTAGVKEAAA